MKLVKIVILLLFVVNVSSSCFAVERKKVIAVTQILEYSVADTIRRAILEHLKKEGYEAGKNIEWVYENAHNNMTTAYQIAQKFVSKTPDVIVAISTPSAQSFLKLIENKKIPLVFSSITDPVGARLIKNEKKPGGWITGTTDMPPLEKQLLLIREFFPDIKKIGVPYNPGEQNAASMIKNLKAVAKKLNIELVLSPALKSGDVLMATNNLMGKVTVIYVPLDNTVLQGLDAVLKIANDHKIPVFASDQDSVRIGALASRGYSHRDIGISTADMIIKILNGEYPGNIPVTTPQRDEIYLNLEVAKRLNIKVPSSVLDNAIIAGKIE
jgi:putative tryptophan/tyrosine transport system substrate-binding protein